MLLLADEMLFCLLASEWKSRVRKHERERLRGAVHTVKGWTTCGGHANLQPILSRQYRHAIYPVDIELRVPSKVFVGANRY